jgi:hypothetical protein
MLLFGYCRIRQITSLERLCPSAVVDDASQKALEEISCSYST